MTTSAKVSNKTIDIVFSVRSREPEYLVAAWIIVILFPEM